MMTHPETQVPLMYTITPGLSFLTIGILLIIKRILFLRNARDVLGEVISMEARYSSGPFDLKGIRALPCYLPQVRFTADNGREYTFVNNFASKFFSCQVGSPILVVTSCGHLSIRCVLTRVRCSYLIRSNEKEQGRHLAFCLR